MYTRRFKALPFISILMACAVFSFLLVYARAAEPGKLELAIGKADLDWDNCTAYGDKHSLGQAPRETLAFLLGLDPGARKIPEWSTGPLAGEIRHFRIAFRRPVLAGTICSRFSSNVAFVASLKKGVRYPGDIANEAHWAALPAGEVKTLGPGSKVRALRFTHKSYQVPWVAGVRSSAMSPVLLLKGRFYSPAALGGNEWSVLGEKARRHRRAWRDAVVDQWLGYWPRKLTIAGVVFLRPPPPQSSFDYYPAGKPGHPGAVDTNWQDAGLSFAPARRAGPAAYAFLKPLAAKGMRLWARDYCQHPVWRYGRPAVLPLVALPDDKGPPTSFLPETPFAFSYQMPMAGFIAIRIKDAKGRDVRRLIAEVERPRGQVREPWDLKNDLGGYVRPGKYAWRAIARPPLKLTYEMTVYTAGKPPWQAPVPGGGGWMADHSPPAAVCGVGDHMIMGSGGAEFGQDTIATDLEGNKVWGTGHLPALRLTSDMRYAYIVQDHAIIRLDPQNGFAREKILGFKYSENLPGHAPSWISSDTSGVACRGGRLYVSYAAPEPPWIVSAVKAGDFDLMKCFPPPPRQKVHETAYNPRQRIFGTFLAIRTSTQAYFGDAPAKGAFAHTLMLALNKEVPIGSIVVPDGRIRVYALKQGMKLPREFNPKVRVRDDTGLDDDDDDLALDDLGDLDDRFKPRAWIPLTAKSGRRPGIAVADKGVRTRILMFNGPELKRLEYSLVLNRRYQDASPKARLVVLEGRRTKGGGWTTTRAAGTRPICYGDPAIACLLWPKPQKIRGYMITRPMPRVGMIVDIWNGAADARITPAEMKDNSKWRQVRHHKPGTGMVMTWHIDTVLHGDLGQVMDVRAMRLRIVEPPSGGAAGRTVQRGAISGGFGSWLTFQPIGRDPELPRSYAKRITVVQLPKKGQKQARVLRHLRAPSPTVMTVDRHGAMYVALQDGVAKAPKIAEQTGVLNYELIIPRAQVQRPRGMAMDKAGLLYIADGQDNCIKVFEPRTRRLVRTIGKARQPGPWNPSAFAVISDICIDQNDKLWVVEKQFQPKRISRFSLDGSFEKDFMGPTHYGGGGFLDPGDHTVVNHLGMKFRLDYKRKTWRLESLLRGYQSGIYSPDRVLYYQGRRYLVGDGPVVTPFGDAGPITAICEEKNGLAIPIVCAGLLSGWREMRNSPDLSKAFGKFEATTTSFVWSDNNRDTKVQVKEVQIAHGDHFAHAAGVGEDLSLNFRGHQGGCRLRLTALRGDGLPVYDLKRLETVRELSNRVMVAGNGETFVMGHKYLGKDGKLRWNYPDHYMSVQGSNKTPWGFYNRPPGVLTGGFQPLGHFKIAGENLFCVGGNNGDYYAFTRDGLLAAAILGGPRGYGRRFFSMPEAKPGKTDLSDLRKTVEDFHGSVTRAEDGKVYAVAGKNHVTVIRVDGLEKMKRLGGTFEVTGKDVQKTVIWAAERARVQQALRRPKIFNVPYMNKQPRIDGDTVTDWPAVKALEILVIRNDKGRVSSSWLATLAFDETNLYLAGNAIEDSPMLNSARDKKMLFQHGDALDLHLGLNPKAEPTRSQAVPGDVRIVFGLFGRRVIAVLYRYKIRGFAGKPAIFKSPMGETPVDEIRELTEAKVKVRRTDKQWFLEAAIPWRVLGGRPGGDKFTLRGDVGALQSDPNGIRTVARYYWANKMNVVMGDLPSEARVIPSLWGEFRFAIPDLADDIAEEDDNGLDLPD